MLALISIFTPLLQDVFMWSFDIVDFLARLLGVSFVMRSLSAKQDYICG